jgi:hypothetical protein
MARQFVIAKKCNDKRSHVLQSPLIIQRTAC